MALNKLQEEILQAIKTGQRKFWDPDDDGTRNIHQFISKEVEEVALKWIEKAFDAGREYEKDHIWMDKLDATNYQQWLIENNLIEKQ